MQRQYKVSLHISDDSRRQRIQQIVQQERNRGHDNGAVEGGLPALIGDCASMVNPKIRRIATTILVGHAANN